MTGSSPLGRFPADLTSFIGREEERRALAALLERHRLVTVVGPGGSGKTRLAVEVARTAGGWPEALFVDLAPLAPGADVTRAVAEATGARDAAPDWGRALTVALCDRRLLLLLDNCEHVLDSCASLVETMLLECPNVAVLATSREPLGVAGEVAWPVPPLDVPSEEVDPAAAVAASAAGRLFLDRAAAAAPAWQLAPQNAAGVAEICRYLEGLPLAIELAAARVRMLSPAEIAANLRTNLDLLAGPARTAGARQHSLRSALQWSYDLLDPEEKALFRRLAVFAGTCDLEALEATCRFGVVSDPFAVLSRLVDRSLVATVQANGHSRFRLLNPIREFAMELLVESGEADQTGDRHAAWFAAFAERASPGLASAAQLDWLRRLVADEENLNAAISWSLDVRHDATTALRILTSLRRFWALRWRPAEGRAWIERALNMANGVPAELQARAWSTLGTLAHFAGDAAASAKAHERALVLARETGNPLLLADTMQLLGYARARSVKATQPEIAEGVALLEEAVSIYRREGNQSGLAEALFGLACSENHRPTGALSGYIREGLAAARASGDRWALTMVLNAAGELARLEGDFAAAEEAYLQVIRVARELGFERRAVMNTANLGLLFVTAADAERAVPRALETFEGVNRLGGNRDLLGLGLLVTAGIALARGEPALAARCLAAGGDQAVESGALDGPDQAYYDRCLAECTALLGLERFDAERERGIALGSDALVPQAIAFLTRPKGAAKAAEKNGNGVAGLTPREAEVLALLAEGLTNREIAGRLVLSTRTVENHLANVYGRIGVRGRAEAVAYAVRLGLGSNGTHASAGSQPVDR